ncbi:hypothetical protein PYCC9005_002900 [Savitreella phatthalungensis]
MRPVKAKIAALKRCLEHSRYVADDVSSWAAVGARAGPAGRAARAKTYGSSRRVGPETSSGLASASSQPAEAPHESRFDFLNNELVSSKTSPAAYNAYLAVFQSIQAIYRTPNQKLTSLTTRCALAVGRCIQLTCIGDNEENVQAIVAADLWYDCLPLDELRSGLEGHCTQLLLDEVQVLAPIWKVLLQILPEPVQKLAIDRYFEVFPAGKLTRKVLNGWLELGSQIHCDQHLRIVLARSLLEGGVLDGRVPLVLESNLTAPLDCTFARLYLDFLQADLVDANDCQTPGQVERHLHFAEQLCGRLIFQNDHYITNRALRLLWTSKRYRNMPHVAALAILEAANSAETNPIVQNLSHPACQVQIRRGIALLPPAALKRLCESFLGIDDLIASALIEEITTQNSANAEWLKRMATKLVQAKSQRTGKDFRWEPVLDSWVEATPAINRKRLFSGIVLVKAPVPVCEPRDDIFSPLARPAKMCQEIQGVQSRSHRLSRQLLRSVERHTARKHSPGSRDIISLLASPAPKRNSLAQPTADDSPCKRICRRLPLIQVDRNSWQNGTKSWDWKGTIRNKAHSTDRLSRMAFSTTSTPEDELCM